MNDNTKVKEVPEKPWILVLCHHGVWPNDNGGKQRIHALFQYLRREFRVCLCTAASPPESIDSLEAGYDHVICGNRLTRICSRKKIQRFLAPILGRWIAGNRTSDTSFNWGQALQVRTWAKNRDLSAVFSEYVLTVELGRWVADVKECPHYLDMIDIQHQRKEQEVKHGIQRGIRVMTLEEEVRKWEMADVLMAIQPEEAREVRRIASPRKLLVVEHAVTPGDPEAAEPVELGASSLLCVASWAIPNVHGLKGFINTAWPGLRERIPGAKLHLVGSSCVHLQEFKDTPGVVLHGRVPDPAPYYRGADVVINPVHYGSGLKIKTVEAIAYGKCLVTTPAGAQGVETEAGEAFVVAEPGELANAIAEVLEHPDRRAQYENAAIRLWHKRYSPDACYGELMEELRGKERGLSSP